MLQLADHTHSLCSITELSCNATLLKKKAIMIYKAIKGNGKMKNITYRVLCLMEEKEKK